MTTDLTMLAWPSPELGTAIDALARRSGLAPRPVQVPRTPEALAQDGDALNRWIESAAAWLGVETEPLPVFQGNVDDLLRVPGLLQLPDEKPVRFLAVLGSKRRKVFILRPDLRIARLHVEEIRGALSRSLQTPFTKEMNELLTDAGISPHRQEKVRTVMLAERLRNQKITNGWQLRVPPNASFWRQMKLARLPQNVILLMSLNVAEYLLWIVSWWFVGRASLEGHFDYGWLQGWGLLLLTLVPFLLFSTWLQGVLALNGGVLLKRRLLFGALRLQPEEVRHQGVGQFLGRVMESEAVESLGLNGGFLAVIAVIELVASAAIMGMGVGGVIEVPLLTSWLLLTLVQAWGYFRQRRKWANTRLTMTHDLVEHMGGHRTRLVQEPSARWHETEDLALERYQEESSKMDRSAALLIAVAPRGWLVLGLVGLTFVLTAGHVAPVSIAISLGGILLGYRALRRLAAALWNVADAAISWEQVASLFRAACRGTAFAPPLPSNGGITPATGKRVEGYELLFHYPDRNEPVLRGCNLSIKPGERILLRGSSGGGKSTLASLLSGLRSPNSGLLLIDGLDLNTLGENAWRRQIVSAPQFHENHVVTETFAFNLLMGRGWPPGPGDLEEAERVCRELGLGELLDRMPAGLLQMVGETGWQLSHGERSRLYIARALLQRADMMILDESFAALDPENLRQSLSCVLRRAPSLMVIAHP